MQEQATWGERGTKRLRRRQSSQQSLANPEEREGDETAIRTMWSQGPHAGSSHSHSLHRSVAPKSPSSPSAGQQLKLAWHGEAASSLRGLWEPQGRTWGNRQQTRSLAAKENDSWSVASAPRPLRSLCPTKSLFME